MPTYLIFHGYRQSSEIIRSKIGKLLPKDATLIVPNGPLDIGDGFYGWFPLNKIELTTGKLSLTDEDVKLVENQTYPPSVDGIIGFSQGCVMAALLVAKGIVKTNRLLLFSPIPWPWDYTIPPNSVTVQLYIGLGDTLVLPAISRLFLPCLTGNQVTIIDHKWGHVIPSSGAFRSGYKKFLTNS